jgi:Secretion system C-terminal sorting domain
MRQTLNAILVLCGLSIPAIINSQSIILEVLASTGDYYTVNGQANIHCTLGETMVRSLENENILTQGFNQYFNLSTKTNEPGHFPYVLYPNPTTDWLIIETNSDKAAEIIIYDLYGRALIEKPMIDSPYQVDISSFADGIYIVCIYEDAALIQLFKQHKIGNH